MTTKRVLLVAAENDALPGGKVGGVGDVIRDVSPALAQIGWRVDVITPSHGFLHRTAGACLRGTVSFTFAGHSTTADLYAVPGKRPQAGVTQLVIDHPAFVSCQGERQIYHHDPPSCPFAFDASKYARFAAAVAGSLAQGLLAAPDVLHLHDWHAAFLLMVCRHRSAEAWLRNLWTVFTIHNLGLQGIRPLRGHESSMASWFPDMDAATHLADRRWPDCVNPMAAAIRLADVVHTVSPSYAEEILRPSHAPCSFGGEGLELDLRAARERDRLFGILNGCDYTDSSPSARRTVFAHFVSDLRSEVLPWIAGRGTVSSSHLIALERLRQIEGSARPAVIFTTVTRLTAQKVYLLRAIGRNGLSGIETILASIGESGIYVVLGSGEEAYETFLDEVSARHANFVFLRGYSDACARALYDNGDVFVMPSSYEPCGITQMLAMRAGQPCIVHTVGGLRDTVRDGIDGFTFAGGTVEQQVDGLGAACARAVSLRMENPDAWRELQARAAAVRFSWTDTVTSYVAQLYLPR